MADVTRIALWSGPRNVSTALMYAFRQRSDTRVVDEPLYAYYLLSSGAAHPAIQDVLADQQHDPELVIEDSFLGPVDRPVLFIKNMAHHLTGLDRGFLGRLTNVLLTRDPREMLPSLTKQVPDVEIGGTSLPLQVELLDEMLERGERPIVVDARLLLEDPPGVIAALCDRVGIDFDPGMLSWQEGPKPEDGIWAPHWYHNVHRSSGFASYRPAPQPVPLELTPLLERCRPLYERLLAHAVLSDVA